MKLKKLTILILLYPFPFYPIANPDNSLGLHYIWVLMTPRLMSIFTQLLASMSHLTIDFLNYIPNFAITFLPLLTVSPH